MARTDSTEAGNFFFQFSDRLQLEWNAVNNITMNVAVNATNNAADTNSSHINTNKV